jgi:DNA-binding transcriptional LysR family regulator
MSPCYQWLLKVVSPYLAAWPDVDVDVKQKFQFGGIGALFGYEIDLLVTPDPLDKPGLVFEPVFDYEQVLVVAADHPLAGVDYVKPKQLNNEVLVTYPVPVDRLDIYTQFLAPAGIVPRGTRPSRPPTSCCRWWPADAAWRPCRAGWCWNMRSRWSGAGAPGQAGHRQAHLPGCARERRRDRLPARLHRRGAAGTGMNGGLSSFL